MAERSRKRKKKHADKWSAKEKLALASCLLKDGEKHLSRVGKAIDPFKEPDRPDNWFSQENCARQYHAMLEDFTHRKWIQLACRRQAGASNYAGLQPEEMLLQELTQQRIQELRDLMRKEKNEYMKLKAECADIEAGKYDEDLRDQWENAAREQGLVQERAAEEEGAGAAGWRPTGIPATVFDSDSSQDSFVDVLTDLEQERLPLQENEPRRAQRRLLTQADELQERQQYASAVQLLQESLRRAQQKQKTAGRTYRQEPEETDAAKLLQRHWRQEPQKTQARTAPSHQVWPQHRRESACSLLAQHLLLQQSKLEERQLEQRERRRKAQEKPQKQGGRPCGVSHLLQQTDQVEQAEALLAVQQQLRQRSGSIGEHLAQQWREAAERRSREQQSQRRSRELVVVVEIHQPPRQREVATEDAVEQLPKERDLQEAEGSSQENQQPAEGLWTDRQQLNRLQPEEPESGTKQLESKASDDVLEHLFQATPEERVEQEYEQYSRQRKQMYPMLAHPTLLNELLQMDQQHPLQLEDLGDSDQIQQLSEDSVDLLEEFMQHQQMGPEEDVPRDPQPQSGSSAELAPFGQSHSAASAEFAEIIRQQPADLGTDEALQENDQRQGIESALLLSNYQQQWNFLEPDSLLQPDYQLEFLAEMPTTMQDYQQGAEQPEERTQATWQGRGEADQLPKRAQPVCREKVQLHGWWGPPGWHVGETEKLLEEDFKPEPQQGQQSEEQEYRQQDQHSEATRPQQHQLQELMQDRATLVPNPEHHKQHREPYHHRLSKSTSQEKQVHDLEQLVQSLTRAAVRSQKFSSTAQSTSVQPLQQAKASPITSLSARSDAALATDATILLPTQKTDVNVEEKTELETTDVDKSDHTTMQKMSAEVGSRLTSGDDTSLGSEELYSPGLSISSTPKYSKQRGRRARRRPKFTYKKDERSLTSSVHSGESCATEEAAAQKDGSSLALSFSTSSLAAEDYVSSSSPSFFVEDEKDEEKAYQKWKKNIKLDLERAASHRYAFYFLQPVTDRVAVSYSNIVHSPTDLRTLKKQIKSGVIRTTVQYQRNILLMLVNALMYNRLDEDMQQQTREYFADLLIDMQENQRHVPGEPVIDTAAVLE